MMRYRNTSIVPKVIIAIFTIGIISIMIAACANSEGKRAKKAVQQFYSFEQQGEFASSWELFHSHMKEKFKKGPYIQDRSHVFMNHFGVETFTFRLTSPKKIKNWTMAKDDQTFESVYKITVIQTYHSKYGIFHIHQDVLAIHEEDQWRIAWDYND